MIGCSMSTGGTTTLTNFVPRTYTDWVARAGGVALGLPNGRPDLAEAALALCDGLLLSGGNDVHPLHYGAEPAVGLGEIDAPRDAYELPLTRAALARGLPLLGICRGVQTLNVAAGGTLEQDLRSLPNRLQHQMNVVGERIVHHTVDLVPGSQLARILGATQVATNSYHHQAVAEPGAGLVVCARATDGTVEAVEAADGRFVIGVQWHPEMMAADHEPTAKLFAAFLAACARSAGESDATNR
ncbi:MAG TPA: hypothetical protein DCZ72_01880 [Armatimonadetes bacterium]|nr:hypothetical protein [Armatimonadota bacterium]